MTKVLVADDHPANLKMLQCILEKNGYITLTAADGHQVWQYLSEQPDLHLAIIDWMMPGLNGVEICRRLQEQNRTDFIYVILLTALEGTENITTALQAGASDYITKPFKTEELLARLNVGRRIIDLQSRLIHAHKMESIGQLAAGIAHEINTPIQYIGDNLNFLQESFSDIINLVNENDRRTVSGPNRHAAVNQNIKTHAAILEVDVEYMTQEIPRAIRQSLEGVNTVSAIVRAMKEFAHPGMQQKTPLDINKAIENTITISRNCWKYVAELTTDYDVGLPLVPCFPGEINQVILNLIVNAVDAITEAIGSQPRDKGKIHICTRRVDAWAEIRISDTGMGIPAEIQDRIMEPFFTTKEIGKGSGQGLAIAYSVVVNKHGGTLTFETEKSKGTIFIIRLPVESDESQDESQNEGAYAFCRC